MATKTEDYLGITDYKVIGTRPIRHDGVDKVVGRAKYGADIDMAGMLHGAVARSPHAHARIKSLDTRKAEALPGVKAVIAVADLPLQEDKIEELGEGAANLQHLRANVLADGKVLYHGHAIAAVAATDVHTAQEAVDLIEIEYEVLQPVLTVREAMQADAPLLLEDLTTQSLGEDSEKKSNVCTHFRHELGDIEKGFAEADLVIEREFDTATVHQGYIEPQNATALWGADGQITVWCSTQGAFDVRAQTAQILEVSVSQVKVVPMEIGGGFGGKIRIYLEPLAAILSKKTGRPVKMVMSRTEVLQATGPTAGSVIRCKMGVDKAGNLIAAQADMRYESGSFPGSWAAPGAMCIFAPYNIPHVLIDGYEVLVNKPWTHGLSRAGGDTNAAFASETLIDELCEQLGVDPLAFRLKNSAKEGTRRADGPVYPRIGHEQCVETARDSEHYATQFNGKNRGRGVASGFWFNVGLKSSAAASVNPDGTVSLVEGSTDIGGTRTSIAMQLAEVLGIGAEEVKPQVVDTDSVGETDVTGGSRTTFATGWAAYQCALDIKAQMIERAAKLWEIAVDDVVFEDGSFSSSDASKTISFKELAGRLDETGGPLMGRATVNPPGVGGAFAVMIADVEVDTDTGKVEILRVSMIQDAGKAIHPSYVEGQMQGGTAQGIGVGTQRGIRLQCGRAFDQCEFARLSHADVSRFAHDRDAYRRSAKPRPILMACAAWAKCR